MTHHSNERPIYLAIIWHQHQPLYVDARHDCLIAPWVRTHATKDYYDMAAVVEQYPDVHCTVNLTTSLLKQLQHFYIDRLSNCIDLHRNTIDLKKFHRTVHGKTDPWIDLLVKPADQFDYEDRNYLYRNPWNALVTSEVLLERFPEYEELRFRFRDNGDEASVEELRELKFWFFLAHFDPDFLNGSVNLPTGHTSGVHEFVTRRDGKFYLRRPVTEEDCQRILVETYKILINIIPIHKKLAYSADTHAGQLELITTPYAHPILPLIYDSDIARTCQPHDPLSERFSFPGDADMHIKKALKHYREWFGTSPVGMWPAEGAVSHDVISLFARNGIRWIATDKQILDRSNPSGSHLFPYRVSTEWSDVTVLFRDTHLSDKVGFTYQTMKPEDAADDFVNSVLSARNEDNGQDKLLTVILDGENAWEWYRFDHDGKQFLHLLYEKLSRQYESRNIVTVTPSEFLLGNSERGVPAHLPTSFQNIDWLWPGSWIHANFDTWIGEEEENKAWNYLLQARRDLEQAGVPLPHDESWDNPRDSFAYQAWEEMFAAEGSDWFWWYGEDQNAPGGDKPFDVAYLTHLRNIYYYARQYGAEVHEPHFEEIIKEKSHHIVRAHPHDRGAMVRGVKGVVPVLFRCRIPAGIAPESVYIAGNREELGEWVPNRIRLYDDGTHGDEQAGDGVWSLLVELPLNAEVHYKYTHSGIEGHWEPGDEYRGRHRTLVVHNTGRLVVEDVFGEITTQ